MGCTRLYFRERISCVYLVYVKEDLTISHSKTNYVRRGASDPVYIMLTWSLSICTNVTVMQQLLAHHSSLQRGLHQACAPDTTPFAKALLIHSKCRHYCIPFRYKYSPTYLARLVFKKNLYTLEPCARAAWRFPLAPATCTNSSKLSLQCAAHIKHNSCRPRRPGCDPQALDR